MEAAMPEVAEGTAPLDEITLKWSQEKRPALMQAFKDRNLPLYPALTTPKMIDVMIAFEKGEPLPHGLESVGTVSDEGAEDNLLEGIGDDEESLIADDGAEDDEDEIPTGKQSPAAGAAASTPAAGSPDETEVQIRRRWKTTTNGPIIQKDGAIGVFRKSFVVGNAPISDEQHFGYIRRTHEAAEAAGYRTRGGGLAAERVFYGRSARGRTAVYQVSINQKD